MLRGIKNYFNKKNLKDDKYLFLFDEKETGEYVCFDCETTGLNPKVDDIISIGAVKIKGNRIIASTTPTKYNKVSRNQRLSPISPIKRLR